MRIRKQRLAQEKAENPKLYDIERKVELEQGARMIMLRKKAGITQKDLGLALGISQSEISKYEAGQRSFDIQFIESVSAALKISPQEFIGL
ncbi:hypothetical protein AZI86_10885 [Bdellovibrio bacteriovorus]|uniref:HTH cro/C1-type domain-containing protein n=1 Tax=Bdellovibrio bacteriovorus TaxID=959 RepID=A0A150WLA0_BDEBC|nr:helix-turn-helix transcriptional regulator [Bdellovibrio bacteriovorus]KYG64708.1 hypothetical protein AZI86_10885 [Bdellovibrio bacteriovorus]